MNFDTLASAAAHVTLSPEARARILERGRAQINKRAAANAASVRIRRTAVLAVVLAMLISVTACATAGKIGSWNSFSSFTDKISRSLPSDACIERRLGYLPDLTEDFSNGFSLIGGSFIHNSFTGEAGEILEKFMGIQLEYERGGERLNLFANLYKTRFEPRGEAAAIIGEIELRYLSYTGKFVPIGYELTAQDKAAEKSGELIFSYGTDEVELHRIQSVCWEKGGVSYCLMQTDSSLSREELIEMAQELLNQH